MQSTTKIAILGGGEEELSILSEFHRTPGHEIVAIYDTDPLAVALEIAEIIGVPTFSDESFLEAFRSADYIIVSDNRTRFEREIALLRRDKHRIVNPTEAAHYLAAGHLDETGLPPAPWPMHLDEALKYIEHITDRGRLLTWLLEVAVRSVSASSGSIMLHSPETGELYIGYATGLSNDVIRKTRQRIGEGIAGEVAQTRRARLIEEIVDTHLYREGRERRQIQSAISAPLLGQDRLIGVLNVSTDRGERKLTAEDIDVVTLLTGKIAPILEQHLRIDTGEIKEIEYRIRDFLESLFRREIGFHDTFTYLCRFTAEKIAADTVSIYTATEEGNWLTLGGSDQQFADGSSMPRIHCIRGSLARAFLTGRDVIMTEASRGDTLALKHEGEAITSVYIPLIHDQPLGVLVVELSDPASLERFFRIKETIRFQISLFTYSRLREIRQNRRMQRLEELSALTPRLLGSGDTDARIDVMPQLLSSLLGATMGSFSVEGAGLERRVFFNFPADEHERQKRIAGDTLLLDQLKKEKHPICTSFLSLDVDLYDEPPLYRSVVGYPLLTDKLTAIYIGYDKIPSGPLDSAIFGEQDIEILRKVEGIIGPLFALDEREVGEIEPLSFDELLKSNQKIFLDRIREEIDRAARYHHGFTVTIFKISGLVDLLNSRYQSGLTIINELSLGIRRRVRKTDYFCWIESDLFGVLSLESYRRIGFLEKRINDFLNGMLREAQLYDQQSFFVSSSYALYPGSADSPTALLNEAKSKLK